MQRIARTVRGLGVVLALLALALGGALTVTPPAGQAAGGNDTIITLRNDFIAKYKDRVTIEADFNVDEVGPVHKVQRSGNDGDMHFSGRAKTVGLPIVAEIMNARLAKQKPALTAVRDAKGGDPVPIAGAWRLWCEHANSSQQVQGQPLEPFDVSNPDHVFEIHPVTKFGAVSTLGSVTNIDGYEYYDAHTAFTHYANVKCKIRPNGTTTTLRTQMAGYNYVEFVFESMQDPDKHLKVEDGRFIRGNVRDTDGDLVARDVRMAFILGTAAEKAARTLANHGRLHLTGIPRIDLALVDWRVQNKDSSKYKDDQPLDWNLPYEIIVTGVLTED